MFRVPGYAAAFHARKGLSDVRVFNQVVLRRAYVLPFELPGVRFIVDAGANVGYASRDFARMFPAARILAIEPDASNHEILRRNLSALPRAEAFLGALWHTLTRLSISNPDAPKTAIMVGEGADPTVATLTVPEIIRRHGPIDVLKMDIEGAEKEVFSAADLSWLDQVRCLIVELHDFMREGCSVSMYRALAGREFQQYVSGENLIIRLRD